MNSWKDYVYERIQNDASLISQTLFEGKSLGNIRMVNAADNREDEFRPCFVECEVGRFLYKPRDVRFEDAFGKLACSLFEGEVYSPKYVVCDGYGYTEYVSFEQIPFGEALGEQALETIEEQSVLSYRLGKVHALYHALGRMDLSRDNIVAYKDTPVLIDTEVCLDPKQYPLDGLQQCIEEMAKHNEVLQALLDSPFRGGAALFAFARVERSLVESFLPCNHERYMQGYEDGWNICFANQTQLERFVRSCKDWTIRVVLSVGSPFQQDLANMFASSEKFSIKQDKGQGQREFVPKIDRAILEELKANVALQGEQHRGPIYRAQVNKRTLYDVRSGKEYTDFFELSALDNTLDHLARMHKDQAKIITGILRELLTNT